MGRRWVRGMREERGRKEGGRERDGEEVRGSRVNVKGCYECVIPRDILIHNEKNILIPNNKEDCDVSVLGGREAGMRR